MTTTERAAESGEASTSGIHYRVYRDEHDLPIIQDLVGSELSEPYSIFTYRYFLQQWPQLSFIAYDGDKPFGCVVSKMDIHKNQALRGYVAMLVVDKTYRGMGVGSELVKRSIQAMIKGQCEEVVLEAEVGNHGALKLYQGLGFLRDKRLHRYYLNGADAYRLKLLLPLTPEQEAAMLKRQEQAQAEFDQQLASQVPTPPTAPVPAAVS